MLSTLLTTLLVFNCLFLIILIIVFQHGNEGGIGSAFGSGNSAGFFGASGGVDLIVRTTWVAGISFFLLATTLAWVRTNENFGVSNLLESSEPTTKNDNDSKPTDTQGTLDQATPQTQDIKPLQSPKPEQK